MGPDRHGSEDEGPRSKRIPILRAAVEQFGEHGYEHARWSQVAERVSIGETALYHYFESKAHCLLVILSRALERSLTRVVESSQTAPNADLALRSALARTFEVSEFELLELRVLQHNLAILEVPRRSAVEEAERCAARESVRAIEDQWTLLLERGRLEGTFSVVDARLTSRLMLGMITGVWRWYRPDGDYALHEIGEFMSDTWLRVLASPVNPDP